MRGPSRSPEVLLGRREPRSRFMPSVYVFPGGSVDDRDFAAAVASELPAPVRRRLQRRASPARARALGVAALRETFEETGLAFGRLEGDRLAPALDTLAYVGRAITPTGSPIRFHARFFLTRASHAHGRLAGNGELLDLRWIPLREALGLEIIDVTAWMLEETQRRLLAGASGPADRSLFIHYRNQRARVDFER